MSEFDLTDEEIERCHVWNDRGASYRAIANAARDKVFKTLEKYEVAYARSELGRLYFIPETGQKEKSR